MDNATFERDQKNFFNPFVPNAPYLYLTNFWCIQEVKRECIGNEWAKKVEGATEHVDQIPEKTVKFFFSGSEHMGKDDRTSEMAWMESVSEQLREKITNVKEFNTTEEDY